MAPIERTPGSTQDIQSTKMINTSDDDSSVVVSATELPRNKFERLPFKLERRSSSIGIVSALGRTTLYLP